ncbi:MAG TPA: hypothetical protein PK003_10030, partial [Bacillota bacterium]|nr:hypothetical protein [Bacillota bacterium]
SPSDAGTLWSRKVVAGEGVLGLADNLVIVSDKGIGPSHVGYKEYRGFCWTASGCRVVGGMFFEVHSYI